MTFNYYTATTTATGVSGNIIWTSSDDCSIREVGIRKKEGIAPELYFKYIKSKFKILENMRVKNRLKELEKAFDRAVENGQDVLASKFLRECVREAKETLMYAKGIKMFIAKEDLDKHKRKIRNGHISDTKIAEFTRVIPDIVLKKKAAVDMIFDSYVIYHYWDEAVEEKIAKKQKMTSEEKSAMRDPVLFGLINESDRLYFVAEWDDDHCDLSFEEIIDVIGKSEEEISISRQPQLPQEKMS